MLDLIKSRRSIRDFVEKPIPAEVLHSLLEAIRWAPSGGNNQPWQVVVVQEESSIRKIKMFSPGLGRDPTALIVLCNDMSIGGTTHLMDVSMAAQNVLLVATDNRLGSCPVRSFNQKAIQILLHLPSYVVPQLIISLGYPAKRVSPPSRRAIEDFVHWEAYDADSSE